MVSPQVHISLSPFDHVPPGNYTCCVLYFAMKPGVSSSQAFRILLEGLHETFVQLPWLDGRVWPQSSDVPGWRPGQLEIRHSPVTIDGPRPHQLKFKELETFMSYNDLKDLGFPTDGFDDQSLIWFPFAPDVNTGPEVFVAQANFIPGACLLTVAVHHSVSDGMGLLTIVQLWADQCKSLESAGSRPPVQVPGPESYDRTVLEKIWAKSRTADSAGNIDPMTWTMFGIDPRDINPETTTQESQQPISLPTRVAKSMVFYMPPANVDALQTNCGQDSGTQQTIISGNDAICALIWRSLFRATASQKSAAKGKTDDSPDHIAHLALNFDGRMNFSQSVPPNYLGNFAVLRRCALPLSTLVSPANSIASVAHCIHESAKSITTDKLLDAYTLARDIPDFNRLVMRAAGLDAPAMLISSLLMAPIYDVSFGDSVFGNRGVPEAVRPLMSPFNRWTRIAFILPRKVFGGVEFVVNLLEEEMDFLLEDEELSQYAMVLS